MNVTLPDDVSEIIILWSVLFLVKQYIASALGLEFMNCILSSIFSSCQTKKRITINVQHSLSATDYSAFLRYHHIYKLHSKASKETYKTVPRSACDIVCLTVIIGSNGPKTSSVIIAAWRGGSTRIVGSMNLNGDK